MSLTPENRKTMWRACGWVPGGMMPNPDLISWADINKLVDAARAEGPVTGDGCLACANGNDLPDGEACAVCGRVGHIPPGASGSSASPRANRPESPLARAVRLARGSSDPPNIPLRFSSTGDGDVAGLVEALKEADGFIRGNFALGPHGSRTNAGKVIDRILAALSAPTKSDELRKADAEVETRAREIYEGWSDQPGYVPWVPGGNSLKQDEARRLALSTLQAKEAGRG